jgi:hypothetical protein
MITRRAQPASRQLFTLLALPFLLLTTTAGTAHAGFQQVGFKWVAPVEDSTPPVVIGEEPSGAYLMAPQDTSPAPVVIQGNRGSNLPAVSSLQTGATASGVVEGFADNVPLTVALRQVVPPQYAVSPQRGVDTGALVSWRGGRSWQDVLQSMLTPLGLEANVSGDTVRIAKGLLPTPPGQMNLEPLLPLPPATRTAAELMPMPEMAPMADLPPIVPQPVAPVTVVDVPKNLADGLKALPDDQMGGAAVPPMDAPMDMGMQPLEPAPISTTGDLTPLTPEDMAAPLATTPMMPVATGGQLVMPELPTARTETWVAERGRSLRDVVGEWCQRANVELVWSAEYDYPLQASLTFNGTFEEAVRGAIAAFTRARPQPFGKLHTNSAAGQRVLVVEARGNNYGE